MSEKNTIEERIKNLKETGASQRENGHWDFRDVDISQCELEGIDLEYALFDDNTIWPFFFDYKNCGAIGPKANLQGINLSGVNLQGANLQGANLQHVNLEGGCLIRVILWNANLMYANLQGANLLGADLQDAELEKSLYDSETTWPEGFDYQNCGATYIGPRANLQGANLQGANLQDVKLYEAFYNGDTKWPPEFNLQTSGAYPIGPDVNLKGADLQEANLQEADLQRTSLQSINLKKALLQNANLQGANLQGANLQDTNLQGANLQEALLRDAHLNNADLRGANLLKSDLHRVTLHGALYDEDTLWPEGFEVQYSGAIIFHELHDTLFEDLASNFTKCHPDVYKQDFLVKSGLQKLSIEEASYLLNILSDRNSSLSDGLVSLPKPMEQTIFTVYPYSNHDSCSVSEICFGKFLRAGSEGELYDVNIEELRLYLQNEEVSVWFYKHGLDLNNIDYEQPCFLYLLQYCAYLEQCIMNLGYIYYSSSRPYGTFHISSSPNFSGCFSHALP